MNEIIARNPCLNELPLLYNIWDSIFGKIGRESFFRLFFKPELCAVAEINGSPVACGYLVPFGDIKDSKGSASCAMIYSVASLPEHRGLGLGSAVVNKLNSIAGEVGFAATVLCPSEDRLFNYYNKLGFFDCFYINEVSYKNNALNHTPLKASKIPAEQYISQRDTQLSGLSYIKYDVKIFEYQELLCEETGGGLYRIGDFYAVVESSPDNTLWFKEFLYPGIKESLSPDDNTINNVISTISQLFPADEFILRFPSKPGEGRRFGMLAAQDNIRSLNRTVNDFSPWYGVSFD
ncbi:MAG: GNAT family N-acetyltransferase [Oscillospiraceae bacterium]|nr:GNAT family N-acetyltransferase [Oscillospiraceae bacterium]